MQTCSVYWIHAPHHSDPLTEGYVGVCRNTKSRWNYGHKWAQKKGRHENPILSNAINKYGWDGLVKKVMLIADEDYCYDFEEKIRPQELMGWNIAIGGGRPPINKPRGAGYISPLKGVSRPTPWMIGRTPANFGVPVSDETRAKISAAGKGKKNTLEHLEKRMESRRLTRIARGQIKPFVVNGVQYESSKIASEAVKVSESTLKYWAYGKGNPSKAYAYITECRWVA